MRATDLAAVSAVAALVHPHHFERDAVFAERLALYPQGCHVLAGGGHVTGYIFSHPWHATQPPALDSLLGALPAVPTTYYIHDIALLPSARGRGAAQTMIGIVEARGRALGLGTLSLVTIEEAVGFWRHAGFMETTLPGPPSTLRSYGENALFMVRPIHARAASP